MNKKQEDAKLMPSAHAPHHVSLLEKECKPLTVMTNGSLYQRE